MASTLRLRLLITEDVEDWADMLKSGFSAKTAINCLNDLATEVEISHSRHAVETFDILGKKFFHMASLDQNMPQATSSYIAPEHGLNIVRHITRTGNPPLGAIYTGFGSPEYGNQVGREASMPYKLKSAQDSQEGGEHYLTAEGYVSWYLEEFFPNRYVPRVLEMATESGLRDIRQKARLALQKSRDALQYKTPDKVHLFMQQLDGLRESLLHHLVALTSALDDTLTPPQAGQSAGAYIGWLREAWTALEKAQNSRFLRLRAFLGTGKDGQMVQEYINLGFARLNRLRNEVTHETKQYSWASWIEMFAATVRVMDLLAWLITRPLIAVPVKTGGDMLACVDYRKVPHENVAMPYPVPDALPEYDPATALFTRLSNRDDEPLMDISRAYQLREQQGEQQATRLLP